MPTGKVKWYDTEKGFGFLSNDEGGDVFVHASALPDGVEALKPGSRVEFGVAEGRRGEQALSVLLLDPIPSVAAAKRRPAEDMAPVVEDLIKMLDGISDEDSEPASTFRILPVDWLKVSTRAETVPSEFNTASERSPSELLGSISNPKRYRGR